MTYNLHMNFSVLCMNKKKCNTTYPEPLLLQAALELLWYLCVCKCFWNYTMFTARAKWFPPDC